MKLRHHDRYDYVAAERPSRLQLAGGKRLAVYFALNLEHFSFGEGLGAELAPGGPQPDVLNYAWRDYGNRVGAWYLHDAFDALKLPMAALVNSRCTTTRPQLVAAHRTRGDEIVGHGRTNAERQGTLDEAAERVLIREATARLTEGRGPRAGRLARPVDLAQPSDARPAGGGRLQVSSRLVHGRPAGLVQLPRRQAHPRRALSAGAERHSRDRRRARRTAADFADMIVDQFDEMMELSRDAAPGDGRRAARLHRRPAASPAAPQARPAPHRRSSRDAIWLTTPGAHRRGICDRDRRLARFPQIRWSLFRVLVGGMRKSQPNAPVHRDPRHRDQHLLAAADQPRELPRVGVLPAGRASGRRAAHVHRAAVRRPARAPRPKASS